MPAEDPDAARDRTELAPASPRLADQLARADLKARLFGAPAESTRVGRFAVLRKIGAGGMGVVYAAYDEQLGRKVAIKLVRPGHDDPDAGARSRREAQALARLSHPNVVQVYEVGEYQGQVYLAMEFVQGQTLRAWQTQAPRRWQETVAMYLQAGRGLAAAHARGLVHRDFKPDNVLVGDEDQRPRVLDFGLARVPLARRDPPIEQAVSPGSAGHDLPLETAALAPHAGSHDLPLETAALAPHAGSHDLLLETAALAPHAGSHDLPLETAALAPHAGSYDLPLETAALAPPPADPLPGPDTRLGLDPTLASPDPARLTTPGAVLGTPGYMAPEQLAGREADLRSDVFGFCAALHEALHGARPFAGEQHPLRAVARSERSSEVPTWLQRVVERGLLADPSARWPAMEPLLLALTRDPTRRRRRVALVAVALVLLVLGVLGLLELRDRQQDADLAAQRARTEAAEAAAERARADTDAEQRRGEARRLAAQADLQAGRDPVLRLLLAIEAIAVHTRSGDSPQLEAEQALLDALDSTRSRPFLPPDAAVIQAIAESPDGRWLATGERGGAITLWATADPLHSITLRPADDQPIQALAFSPDTGRLAALVGTGALVWTLSPKAVSKDSPAAHKLAVPGDSSFEDVPNDSPSARKPAVPGDSSSEAVPNDSPSARKPAVPGDIFSPPVQWDSPVLDLRDLEWSPDGRALLARAGDLAIVLRADAAPLLLRGHTGPVRRAVWSPDGAQLLTASADGSARLWPARGGAPRILQLPAGDPARRGLWSAEFSPDGREVALASADHSAAIVPLRGGPTLRLRGHTGEVYAASFTAGGAELVTVAMDDTARLWDRDGTSVVIPLEGHAELLGGVRIGPDHNLLLGTPAGGPAWVWQLDQPGSPLVLHGHRGSVVNARFSADGRRVLTASADGSARRWQLGDDPNLLRGHAAGLEHASFAPDGRTIATASMDGTARLWPRDGRPSIVLRGHREGSSISAAFSPDGRRFATAGADGLARLWSLDSQPPALLATLPAEAERDAPLLDLQWSPAGDRLALAAEDGRVHLVRFAADGRPAETDLLTGHTGPIHTIAFAPDGAHLASAGDDAQIRVWLLAPPPALSDTLSGHTGPVRSLAFTADGRQLLSAGDDASARVWSLAEPAAPLVLSGHRGSVWQVRSQPQRGQILTASADGTARVWPAEGGLPALLLGHADAVWVATPSPDGLAILTTSSDGTARLWRRDGEEYRALRLPQAGSPGAADHTLWLGSFSPDGRLALTAGADGLARVFPIELQAQLAEACARAGHNLDPTTWAQQIGERPYQRSCPDLPAG